MTYAVPFICCLAAATRGEIAMHEAELVGVPVKAVVFGNSHAAIAPGPGGADSTLNTPGVTPCPRS